MAFKMKGSPAKMGGIQGTSGHASALMKSPLEQKLSTTEKIKAAARAFFSGLPGIKDSSTLGWKYRNEKKKIRKKKKTAEDRKKNPDLYR